MKKFLLITTLVFSATQLTAGGVVSSSMGAVRGVFRLGGQDNRVPQTDEPGEVPGSTDATQTEGGQEPDESGEGAGSNSATENPVNQETQEEGDGKEILVDSFGSNSVIIHDDEEEQTPSATEGQDGDAEVPQQNGVMVSMLVDEN